MTQTNPSSIADFGCKSPRTEQSNPRDADLAAGRPPYTRRRWISSMASLAAGAGILGSTRDLKGRSQPPEAESGIVDGHVHVWSADTAKYPFAPGFSEKDLWFPSFTVEEVMERSQSAGVRRVNLVQMTWYGLDHSYILDAIAREPKRFVGTGVVPAVSDVSGPAPDRAMEALSRRGIYAFRIRGKTARSPIGSGPGACWLDHPGYDLMFAAGAKHNLALSFLMNTDDIPELDRMCAKFPETPVIVDHLCGIGSTDPRRDEKLTALCGLAKHRKVLVKVGAFYALGKKQPPYLDMLPIVRRVVEAFGPERCMWESDAPKGAEKPHTFLDAVAVIKEHADFLSPSEREQILVKTAGNFFFNR